MEFPSRVSVYQPELWGLLGELAILGSHGTAAVINKTVVKKDLEKSKC